MTTTEDTLHVARATSARLESTFGGGWDQASSLDYHQSIIGGVGAFEFVVDETEAMFKLSQEKTPEVQQRIIDTFLREPRGSSQDQIARVMVKAGLGAAVEPQRSPDAIPTFNSPN
jgi:transcriptional regulator